MQSLKAVHHITVSSAETIGAFNAGLDTVNLHRPTLGGVQLRQLYVDGTYAAVL
jgi:hypothetical protein